MLNNSSGTMADINLNDITSSNPNMDKVNTFYEFDVTANSDWIYKMFVEKVTFSVFLQNRIENVNEITFTLTITNAITEEDVGKNYGNELTDEEKKFVGTYSIVPQENGRFDISIDVNRVLGVADGQVGSKFQIDISEYAGGTDSNGNITPLKWIMYGFSVYGESRTYN